MIASLQDFLDNVRIEWLILCGILYLLILWLLVPIWVYLDAKKKFENDKLPIIFFWLILPFNIPGLIFYIIIRPEDDKLLSDSDEHLIGVPVVKFLNDKEDFVMSFDLKINGKVISPDHRPDLKLNINIDPNEENVILRDLTKKTEIISPDLKNKNNILKNNWNIIKGFFITEKQIEKHEIEDEVKDSEPKNDLKEKHSPHKKKKRR